MVSGFGSIAYCIDVTLLVDLWVMTLPCICSVVPGLRSRGRPWKMSAKMLVFLLPPHVRSCQNVVYSLADVLIYRGSVVLIESYRSRWILHKWLICIAYSLIWADKTVLATLPWVPNVWRPISGNPYYIAWHKSYQIRWIVQDLHLGIAIVRKTNWNNKVFRAYFKYGL